jgi:hypothetical protein
MNTEVAGGYSPILSGDVDSFGQGPFISQAEAHGNGRIIPQEFAPLRALEGERIRELVSTVGGPAVSELVCEIYRLHGLLRGAAMVAETIQRNSANVLDITSRTLLLKLAERLKQEPAITGPRIWDTQRPRTAKGNEQASVEGSVQSTKPPRDGVAEDSTGDSRERLFTWKLVPQPGRAAADWSASPYKGTVIVRAYDPVHARTLVAQRFKLLETPDEQLSKNPWARKSVVRCELVEDPAYDHIGSAQVVYP